MLCSDKAFRVTGVQPEAVLPAHSARKARRGVSRPAQVGQTCKLQQHTLLSHRTHTTKPYNNNASAVVVMAQAPAVDAAPPVRHGHLLSLERRVHDLLLTCPILSVCLKGHICTPSHVPEQCVCWCLSTRTALRTSSVSTLHACVCKHAKKMCSSLFSLCPQGVRVHAQTDVKTIQSFNRSLTESCLPFFLPDATRGRIGAN